MAQDLLSKTEDGMALRIAKSSRYDTIEVTCPPEVSNPVAVRYAFGNYVPGILKNGRGVAVAPFRTDNWPENK